MKFLIDAQLPRRMARWLNAAGHDAVHTSDLPDRNRTTDSRVCDVASAEGRVVVTKDADFVDSHILQGRPAQLLLLSMGNVTNRDLEALFRPLLAEIVTQLAAHAFVEVGPGGVTVRG